MRIKPASYTLTVGEVREATAGNADNDTVTFPDYLGVLVAIESRPGDVEFEFEFESGERAELQDLRDFVEEIAEGKITKAEMIKRAKEYT